ncbi:MAG: molybdopterin-dependent oxidoreductase, partial [Lysobacterales bacterium]
HLIPHVVAPEDFSTGIATWYNTVCSMCAAGCGISVRTREGRAKKIEGNPSHPVSQGRLCALGQAGLQVLYNPDRLTGPLLQTGQRGSMSFAQITWEEGLGKVADRLDLLKAAHRGNRVCMLSQGIRGHLAQLFELFMDQLGSERLLHYDFDHPHTLYAANKRFFGEERLPYYDLKNTRYLLSFGADYLGNWISPVHHSLGFGHSRQGRSDVRGRFVQIEPRMSLSGAAADEWIPAKPGTEGILALGLAHRIVSEGHYKGVDRDDWAAALSGYTTDQVAEQTGVGADTITRMADAFVHTQPSLAIGGGSAGNHSNGVDTLVAVNALNYLVGNLGKSGGLVFNPEPPGPVSHARQASYRTMRELAEDAQQGNIEVLILNGSNPVFTLPSAGFREALAEIPLIVSLSSFMDETTALADIILPSHTYLESWGDDFPEPGVGFSIG